MPTDYSRDLGLVKWGSGVSLHGSNLEPLMSALGQKQTFGIVQFMSALPPKADIAERAWDVRFVPIADIAYSITSSARPSSESGTVRPGLLAILRLAP
jgi:hypothetical protein